MIKIKSELEFKKWFKKNYKKLGYSKIIKDKKGKFPDFIMLKNNKYVGVELETLSSNFILHNHDPKKVNELICIRKDVNVKIPIIEIKELEYESRLKRISATIDKETLEIIKRILKKGNYRNMSHIVEEAIKAFEKNEKKK